MKSLPNSTNGVIVLSDSFVTSIFKRSFLSLFNKDDQGHLQMGFNATFDVQVRLSYHFLCMYAYCQLLRLQKSSKSLVLSVMLSLLAKNRPV